MTFNSLWVLGSSRSGKSTRLAEEFYSWLQYNSIYNRSFDASQKLTKSNYNKETELDIGQLEPGILVFSANNDNRQQLTDKILNRTQGKYPLRIKTPLGFFQDEVILFWPLLTQTLNLKAQFPVRLRPETEQEFATKLWRPHLDDTTLRRLGLNEYRLVRRILDLLQLAAYSQVPCNEIEEITSKSTATDENTIQLEPNLTSELLLNWREWCLERGFLTYGIITELYNQYLLSDPIYQQQLLRRYQAVLADDIQDYPACMGNLFEFLLDNGAVGAFSYNPEGLVRLGLGADPEYMAQLARRCKVETLEQEFFSSLAPSLTKPMLDLVFEPMTLSSLPQTVQSIETTSRAQLLRKTAETIIKAIDSGSVQPQDIAIIAPGLDAIARYTLIEILHKQGICVNSLKYQRPLISSPLVRSLLTILALVYPGLGRLVDKNDIAQMLIVLSRKQGNVPSSFANNENTGLTTEIDPVRAGLIADYCFRPHPEVPQLLPVNAYNRWDRLGYGSTKAYDEILQWLEQQRSNYQQHLIPSPVSLLYSTIERFLSNIAHTAYEQLAALRELLETAQHYWEINIRIKQIEASQNQNNSPTINPGNLEIDNIAQFIQLLRRGTIAANSFPVRPVGPAANAVTLATIYQYRASRSFHRWHFWLDAGSPLWSKGGSATLFGAPLFLQHRLGQPWTALDETEAEENRLQMILGDLLARVSKKIYLCHSDLAVNGQDQLGPFLPLVNACIPVDATIAG